MSINVRYMPDEEIEAEASSLLAGYARKTGTAITVPALLLDDLLQHLGLRFESYDLRKEFGTPDVLGAIYLEEKLIRIDETLDPDERPAMRGRFNFTLAHEIGHWCLHRGDAELRQMMDDLFGGPAKPSIICRTSQQKERVEIQADKFASCLLMPRAQLIQASLPTDRSQTSQVKRSPLGLAVSLGSCQPWARENLYRSTRAAGRRDRVDRQTSCRRVPRLAPGDADQAREVWHGSCVTSMSRSRCSGPRSGLMLSRIV